MPDYTFAITGQDLSGPAWKAFVENVKKANQQVTDLKKPADEVSDRFKGLDGVIDKVKKSLGGMGPAGEAISGVIDKVSKVGSALGTLARFTAVAGVIGFAAKELLDYGEGLQKAASEMAQLAGAHNLTTDQVQALQDLARRTGKTFEEVAGTVGKNKLALDTLTQAYVASGQAIDANVISKVVEMERRSKESSDRIEVHANKIRAAFAPFYVNTKAAALDNVATALGTVAKVIDDLNLTKLQNLLTTAAAVAANPILMGGALVGQQTRRASGREEAEILARIERLQDAKAYEPANRHKAIDDEIAELRKKLPAAQQSQRQAQAIPGGQGWGGPDPFGMVSPVFPEKPPPTGTGGGGGGGPARDRIGENLQLYTDQAKAAEDALADLRAVALLPLPLDDLEREIKLRKAIADAMAQASKFAKDDPRKAQLEQQIRLRETAESEYQRFHAALKTADATERQYGDGQLQFLQTQNNLNDARATGRLTLEAYDVAMKINAQTTEDLRLKNLGLQGGLPAIAAGFEHARLQGERANNMFATGGKVYEQVMSTMTLATTAWGQSFDQVLLRAGESWARFLADMAMREAASSAFKAGGGLLSGIVSSLFSSAGGGASAVTSSPAFGAGFSDWFAGAAGGGMRSAAGGPLRAGQPSIVGEFEPELWVPNTGGNVLNRQQLEALGVGGMGGGSPIIVNLTQHLSVGEFVTPTQLDRASRAAMDGAVAGIMKLQNSGDMRMRQAGF